jgi:hypothetical protein
VTRPAERAVAPALEWIVALLLMLQAATALVTRFEREPGVDFYHFWGIAAARALAPEPLGNPYRDAARYAEILNQHADSSRDRHFQRANAHRRDPTPGSLQLFDPTATPLAYALFAWLPLDYSHAHTIFRALALAAGLAGVAWTLILLGVARPRAWLAAAALPLAYRPIAIDWNVGNLSAYQLAFAALLVRAAMRVPTGASDLPISAFERSYAAALAAFALFKPNTAPIAIALALSFAHHRGARATLHAAATALAAGVALIVATSFWLGSPGAWIDWWSYLQGPSGEKLGEYSIAVGNLSPVALLAPITGLGSTRQSLLHIAIALASLAAALRWRVAEPQRALQTLAEPVAAASIATLMIFLCAPLIWNHYPVLLILPGAWLIVCGSRRPLAISGLALCAFALIAGPADALLRIGGVLREPMRSAVIVFAPTALWLHALASLRRDAAIAR